MSEVVDRELERAIELANNAVDTWLELLEECEVEFGNRTMREQMIRIVAEACAESFSRPFHDPGLIDLKTVREEIDRLREELRQSWYGTAVQSQPLPQYTFTTSPNIPIQSGTSYPMASSGNISSSSSGHAHTLNAADTNTFTFNEYMTKEAVERMFREKFPPAND